MTSRSGESRRYYKSITKHHDEDVETVVHSVILRDAPRVVLWMGNDPYLRDETGEDSQDVFAWLTPTEAMELGDALIKAARSEQARWDHGERFTWD